jgi:hypothetical protein
MRVALSLAAVLAVAVGLNLSAVAPCERLVRLVVPGRSGGPRARDRTRTCRGGARAQSHPLAGARLVWGSASRLSLLRLFSRLLRRLRSRAGQLLLAPRLLVRRLRTALLQLAQRRRRTAAMA